jgi:hypothetical protein
MPKIEPLTAIKHAALGRLRFIDEKLFWEARCNRADLIEAFGISPAQAALDFREYMSRAGDKVSYDPRAKAYVAHDDFEPVLDGTDAGRALDLFASQRDPWTTALPHLERQLAGKTAANIRRAARHHLRLSIDYQSMTGPKPQRRWIAPSMLVSDGERWHARAWCYTRQEWRDFVLARILSIRGSEPAGSLPDDAEWLTSVTLVLRPAARFSDAQRAAISREYAIGREGLRITIPLAMRIYAIRRWGLDRKDSKLECVEESVR